MPRFPVLLLFPLVLLGLPAALHAQQPLERYTIDDDAVAIYNLVGAVRLEPGEGGVAVQVTRAGADAARLRVAQGEIDGRATLRVLYPEDRIKSGRGSRGSSTTLRVREDGTFGDTTTSTSMGTAGTTGTDGTKAARSPSRAASGLDARADLIVRVPRGHRVAVYLAVGSVTVTNVEGDLTLDTHEAEVTANGVKGGLSIDVGSGSVRATQIDGDLSVDTGSGSVEVSRVRGRSLSIDTGSGDVTGSDLEATELSVDTGSGVDQAGRRDGRRSSRSRPAAGA